jgi:hypothetical protein
VVRDLRPFWYSLAGIGLLSGLLWFSGVLPGV